MAIAVCVQNFLEVYKKSETMEVSLYRDWFWMNQSLYFSFLSVCFRPQVAMA